MILSKVEPASLTYIIRHLRAADREELSATRWGDDLSGLAAEIPRYGNFAWVAGLDWPIAAIGAVPMWPGVWSVWMFATDDFARIGLPLTRFVKRSMIPALVKIGAHRAECRMMASHTAAQRWLEVLGARCESTLARYGKGGEDFRCYVWRREDVYAE